jgi:hypothetical protein
VDGAVAPLWPWRRRAPFVQVERLQWLELVELIGTSHAVSTDIQKRSEGFITESSSTSEEAFMSEVTRGEILDIIGQFAAKDPNYLAALVADPKNVLSKQMNQSLPDSLKVKVVQETADTIYVIAPYVPQQGDELSDADLEKVAGGKGQKGDRSESGNSYTCNDTIGIGTRVEIQSIV